MRTCWIVILTFMLTLAGGTGITVAQIPKQPFEVGKGNLRIGPVRVHPFLSVGEMYDSNVFLQPTDTQQDFITVISPGFILNLPAGRHQFTVGYRNDILEYARLNQESNVRYTGQAGVTGKYPGGLSWYLHDEVQRTNERPNTEFQPLIERTQNDGAIGMEYAFADRWAAGINYLNVFFDYDNEPQAPYGTELNRIEQYVSADLYYLLAAKTSVLAEYTYVPITYFNDVTADLRNNQSHIGRVGVRGRITSKLTALAKVGYQAKLQDNPSVSGYDGPVANVSMVYQPTDWTQLTFLFDRQTEEASFIAQGDDFFVWTGFTLLIEHVFNPKLRGFASGSFGNADYGHSQRNDDLYAGSLGMRYQIQDYLAVSVQYLYEQRVSSHTPGYDFDYTDNRVFLRILTGL